MKQRVVVWGEPIELEVHQRSKSVWVASGEYMGAYHQTTDRSPGSAAARWKEWAHTKGG